MARKPKREETGAASGPTRREFLTTAAAAGLPLALPPQLKAWAADAAEEKDESTQGRTLFFNHSHEADHQKARYYFVVAGKRHRLRRVRDHSRVLKRARQTNSFLQAVPDAAVTHFVLNYTDPPDGVALGYVVKEPDTTSGTWQMSSMYTSIATSASAYAYSQARAMTPEGPLPLSAKRKLYGHPPAQSQQDLMEEQALMDTTDHASTLISLHPNMLSGEPNSAAHIHTNYIQTNGATVALGQVISGLGAAEPQQTPGQPNGNGWATLVPIGDDSTGQPARNQNGTNKGLIQYFPDWHPAVDPIAGQGMTSVAPQVHDDETVGSDITGQSLDESTGDVNNGKLWARHDGFTTVDQSPATGGSVTDSGVKWTITDKSVDQGFLVTADVQESNGNIQVTLSNANWYLRWLGVWLQFLDSSNPPQVIPVAQLPPNTIPGGNPSSSTTNELFGTMVPPEFTILAIPVDAGRATLTFNMPPAASTVRILGSGLGTGSVDYPDTLVLGSVLTIASNYGLTAMFLAAGASTKVSPFQKLVVVPIASLWAQELVTLLAADLRSAGGISDPGTWKSMGLTLLKATLNLIGREFLRKVITGIVALITESTLEDSIPIVGQIMRAVAAIVGVADLLHTTVDISLSPWTYVNEMVFTHDVSVNLKPDPGNNNFPETANYYKVTALFDNGGTPHVQTLDLPAGTVSSLPPVVFKDVPRGGQINLSTGFYSRSTDPNKNDWLAAKGTTGLVSNTVDQAPDLTIEQFPVPIQSTTVYQHKQKTTLQSDGTHVWTPTTTPPSAKASDISCEGAGNLCDFRGITVRQGTSQQPGYVGYAWKANSSGLVGCKSGGQGQFDQLANLNTAENPQTGYAGGQCGLPDGVKLSYSLLSHSASNFYLDSDKQAVRQVQLDPTPGFDPPTGNRAWGVLNFTSTSLLLHPTGKLVSINNAENRIETLQIAAAPMTDEDAKVHLLAQTHAGPGSRPGLLGSPTAAAVSPDGVILVLEGQAGNNRLQAFDLGGNPVQFFTKQTKPYFLNLDATAGGDTVYLDLAVEFTGYLYVLSYNSGTNLYRMDIYHPGQSDTQPISTTQSFNAARLTVDFWRNVYALNYELLQLPNGTTPSITEPSISLWTPSVP